MKRTAVIIGIILGTGLLLGAQTMVGLSKEEAVIRVKQEYREFRKDASVIRQQFNYLKYVNRERTRTWILYFTDEDICRTSKLIIDYLDFDKEVARLNEKYRSTGEYRWEYLVKPPTGRLLRRGIEPDTILVELKELEWYFTIRETKKQGVEE